MYTKHNTLVGQFLNGSFELPAQLFLLYAALSFVTKPVSSSFSPSIKRQIH